MYYFPPQEKPRLYGNFQDRQYSIWRNLEETYGCNHEDEVLIIPGFWGLPPLDYSKLGNDGTNYGATYIDGSLDFDGVDDYVDVGDSATYDFSTFTLSAWINGDDYDNVLYPIFIGKWNAGFNREFALGYHDVEARFYFQVYEEVNDLTTKIMSTTIPVTSTWYHIVGVYNGSSIFIYIDGSSDATPINTTNYSNSVSDIRISNTNSGTGSFDGLIDEVRISNVARSAEQIALFHDRPWDLYRRVGRPFYSLPVAPAEIATTSLDSLIKKTISKSLSVDALLQKSIPITVSIDSILQQLQTITTTLDADIVKQYTSSLSIDALLKRFGISSSLSIDALIKKQGLLSQVSIDVLIKKYGVVFQTDIDALISKQAEISTTLDAILISVQTYTITTVIDALILKNITKSLEFDALLYSRRLASTTLDAYLYEIKEISSSLDAVLTALQSEVVGLDALIKKIGSVQTVNLDALLLEGKVAVTTLDSIIYEKLAYTVNMDGLLQETGVSKATFLDAIIYTALVEATPKYEFFAEAQDSFVVEAQDSFRYI